MSSILFTVSSRKFSPGRSVEDVDGIVVVGLLDSEGDRDEKEEEDFCF